MADMNENVGVVDREYRLAKQVGTSKQNHMIKLSKTTAEKVEKYFSSLANNLETKMEKADIEMEKEIKQIQEKKQALDDIIISDKYSQEVIDILLEKREQLEEKITIVMDRYDNITTVLNIGAKTAQLGSNFINKLRNGVALLGSFVEQKKEELKAKVVDSIDKAKVAVSDGIDQAKIAIGDGLTQLSANAEGKETVDNLDSEINYESIDDKNIAKKVEDEFATKELAIVKEKQLPSILDEPKTAVIVNKDPVISIADMKRDVKEDIPKYESIEEALDNVDDNKLEDEFKNMMDVSLDEELKKLQEEVEQEKRKTEERKLQALNAKKANVDEEAALRIMETDIRKQKREHDDREREKALAAEKKEKAQEDYKRALELVKAKLLAQKQAAITEGEKYSEALAKEENHKKELAERREGMENEISEYESKQPIIIGETKKALEEVENISQRKDQILSMLGEKDRISVVDDLTDKKIDVKPSKK